MVKHTQQFVGKIADESFECAWPFCEIDAQRGNARVIYRESGGTSVLVPIHQSIAISHVKRENFNQEGEWSDRELMAKATRSLKGKHVKTGKFKLKAAPNDGKLKCVQEKQDFIAANATSFFVWPVTHVSWIFMA